MRYSTPTRLLKYLHYYWVAANSKGHGIHSPFVFRFIKEEMNAKSTTEAIANTSPSVKKLMQEIEAVTSQFMPEKIKRLIARCIAKFNPSITCILASKSSYTEVEKMDRIDFAFLEAGCSVDLILQNAVLVLQKMHSDSWMIVEGIHTSSEMEYAWARLKKQPGVRLTIDLFFIGLLFCRKEQKEQEHFIIRY